MSDSQLINEGKKAPAFHLPDQAGRKHRLSEQAGKWVVLFFYPRDNTPGCTKEACGFRDNHAELRSAGAVVFGVSADDVKSHARFADKFDLPFPLLADEDTSVCQKYGVWQEKSMYGRKSMGIVRTTYLIDPKGKIARRFDKVKVDRHITEVLDALAELSA